MPRVLVAPFASPPLPVPADPVAIARFLGQGPGLAVLDGRIASGLAPHRSYVASDPIATTDEVLPVVEASATRSFEGEHDDAAAGAGIARGAVPRWIGVVPYEAARSLERPTWARGPDRRATPLFCRPRWYRYGAVIAIDHRGGGVRVVGDDRDRVERTARHLVRGASVIEHAADTAREIEFRPQEGFQAEDDRAHGERVRAALSLIAAGDLYQVNLARRFRVSLRGDLLGAYAELARRAPAPFGACLTFAEGAVCAVSPELFVELDASGGVLTVPIKGTRPRSADPEHDRSLWNDLAADPKENAELWMIVDVLRNDIGRVAEAGSVHLGDGPWIESYRTVHHRMAAIRATLRRGRTPADLVTSMLPSGSVTGAPKVRAMEVIADLEPHRRGLYTGCFGFVAHDGSVRLAMAIRTLTVAANELSSGCGAPGHRAGADPGRATEAYYFAGGGIVADSRPEREVAETWWKAVQLGLHPQ